MSMKLLGPVKFKYLMVVMKYTWLNTYVIKNIAVSKCRPFQCFIFVCVVVCKSALVGEQIKHKFIFYNYI